MDLFCVLLSPREQSAGKSMSIFFFYKFTIYPSNYCYFRSFNLKGSPWDTAKGVGSTGRGADKRLKYGVGEGRLLNQHVATALKYGVVLQEVNYGTTTTII